jgi:DNA-binding MarR family transcriptional regulator
MNPDQKTSREIFRALRRIMRAVELHSHSLIQRVGVTVPQLLLMQTLREPRELSAGELARRIHLSQGTITDLLIRLEKRQLIQRLRDPQDRRRIQVRLTPNGEALVDQAPPLLQDRFLEELDRLADWERTQMLSTLERIATMMQADCLDVAPLLVPGVISDPRREPAAQGTDTTPSLEDKNAIEGSTP